MDAYKPLRAVILFYDVLRLLFLAASFMFLLPMQAADLDGFPYLAFMSSNALFPLIGFFIFLNAVEYRNYIPLYMAGKTIAVILFYAWVYFSLPASQGFMGSDSFMSWIILLGGVLFVSILDALSVGGMWALSRKLVTNVTNGGI